MTTPQGGPPLRFTEDEQINMRLRAAAGESHKSIAEDYDCDPRTVRYYLNEENRIRHNAKNLLRKLLRDRALTDA